jgi:hypothetical protein
MATAIALLLVGLISPASAQPELPEATSRSIEAVRPPPLPRPQRPAQLSGAEIHAAIKLVASRVALALATYGANETAEELAARLPADLAAYAEALHVPESSSTGRIIYPQLGGLLPDSASVMVVLEQRIGSAGGVRTETRTLNVEVARRGGQWRFERLVSSGGTPVVPATGLSPVALAVLSDPRIELPDSARWDIAAGRVDPTLLTVMTRLADRVPYGVAAFSTGHSWEIFGTPRQSDHSRGLAVDIYRIGDRQVIDDRSLGSITEGIVSWLYEQPEVARMGSPWALDGFGGRSFANALHQDHLHIAVYPD